MSRGSRKPAAAAAVPVPPPDPRPYVPAITLPVNRETAFVALHGSVMGFSMHWVEQQHLPHIRERQWCIGCRVGTTFRWEGFLGVVSLQTLNRFILRIPAAAFRNSGLFRERSDAGILAGTTFTGYRFGKGSGKNRPAMIELVDQLYPVPKLHPFPLKPALARYWRMETLDILEEVRSPEDTEPLDAQNFKHHWQKLREAMQVGKEVK
jgi:hypothetical protein